MIWRCAWCEAVLPVAEREQSENTTHGICERHLVTLRAEMAARQGRARGGGVMLTHLFSCRVAFRPCDCMRRLWMPRWVVELYGWPDVRSRN